MSNSPFSAAPQSLGYFFQYRFSLLKALELPEGGELFLERGDDVEHVAEDGSIEGISLKHKARGERLTDLATDLWKSVRIWLSLYRARGKGSGPDLRFVLVTTASVPADTFPALFLERGVDDDLRARRAAEVLAASRSPTIVAIAGELDALSEAERRDFFGRIAIIQETERIDAVPALVNQRLRAVDGDTDKQSSSGSKAGGSTS